MVDPMNSCWNCNEKEFPTKLVETDYGEINLCEICENALQKCIKCKTLQFISYVDGVCELCRRGLR